MTRALLLAVVLAGCHPHGADAPSAASAPGTAISIYRAVTADGELASFALVDERRWIDVVAGRPIAIDDLEPSASLASLTIEAAGDPDALHLGTCTRDTLERVGDTHVTASLRCAVTGRTGHQLVRIVYATSAIAYHAEHELAVTDPTRATISSRFTIDAPRMPPGARVTLFDGAPGAARPPVEVAHGAVALDGSLAVIAVPAHDVAAKLRWIYRGALATPEPMSLDEGKLGSNRNVWVTLELADVALAPGPVHAHVALADDAPRDIVVPDAVLRGARAPGEPLRVPLWIDDALIGTRKHTVESDARDDSGAGSVAERLEFAVSNTGTAHRVVWIEEPLRAAVHRRVVRASAKPALHGNVLTNRVELDHGRIEHIGYTIVYE